MDGREESGTSPLAPANRNSSSTTQLSVLSFHPDCNSGTGWPGLIRIGSMPFPSHRLLHKHPAGEYTFQVIAANNDGLWNRFSGLISLFTPATFLSNLLVLTDCVLRALFWRAQPAFGTEFGTWLPRKKNWNSSWNCGPMS